ncbi:uncharacterized protein C2845_PM02G13120 [Panicum miliaceum]|uniref:Uncharacterized protein n=1 Tax=Panicum miliaceum TaxID=4540 RepID=A0A3L6SA96_PANMI|nr:uncharacterized protein C2845_PM02G13120 [Panicum miliaceum]
MSSSRSPYIPRRKVKATMPKGIQMPICFCVSLCKLIESKVLGDNFSMRFFICENYEYYPPKRYGKERPKWLATEQSQQDKEHVEREGRWVAERWQRMLHEERMGKRKKDQEEIRNRMEEVERQVAEEGEADRERKRERARRTKEARPDAIRKRKYLRCTQ